MHLNKISDQTRLEVLECESAERHIFQPDQSIPCHTMTVHNTLLLVIMFFGQEMIHMIPMTVITRYLSESTCILVRYIVGDTLIVML